ncbi:MAG TPA: TlpA disulfide reductase family protein [Egibacteraceae bacterium]|jgi:cytochrome c biogenesis protein CcmG, thiol:disulfide interchange protein DsbE|nr:TlpA disulfide reductase family protein [Egibacteraceae bacterium]
MDTRSEAGRTPSRGRATFLLSLAMGIAFVVTALAVTALVSGRQSADPGVGAAEEPGLGPISGPASAPLPDATLEAFDEGADPVALGAFRGSPLVVNFWATWCAPCVAEMPDLQAVAEATAGRAVFLGVNYRDPDRQAARSFTSELGITYALAADPHGRFLADVGGVGMPTTLFVDPDGTVVYRHTGALDREQLQALLAEHLDVDA